MVDLQTLMLKLDTIYVCQREVVLLAGGEVIMSFSGLVVSYLSSPVTHLCLLEAVAFYSGHTRVTALAEPTLQVKAANGSENHRK